MKSRAGVGASLSDLDQNQLCKYRLRQSADVYSSRLRVDDLGYLEERPCLYDEFDYIIYNEDFFYSGGLQAAESELLQPPELRNPRPSLLSTRSCSDFADRQSSGSFEVLSDSVGSSLERGPRAKTRGCASKEWCSRWGGEEPAQAVTLPFYRLPDTLELENLLRQRFGDRYGYYPLIGLHSYIPRRVLTEGIVDVLFEVALNMMTFLSGTADGGYCSVLDLTNAIFVVKNKAELWQIDIALAKYSRWIAETQTHSARSQLPFANDFIQYAVRGGLQEQRSESGQQETFQERLSDEEEEELVVGWMDQLVRRAPLSQFATTREQSLYLSALKYLLFAPNSGV